MPALHVVHLEAAAPLNLPAGQDVQLVEIATGAYRPGIQGAQRSAPAALDLPTGHDKQLVEDVK